MSTKEKKPTPLSEIGEFGLIDRLTRSIKCKQPTTVKGIGDDAAVLDTGDKFLVVTTDMLMEGIHFDRVYSPMMHLGYKAVVVNLSDIYAMNATPKQITVSIAVSNHYSLESLDELYTGIKQACEVYKVDLVGGDTTSSLKGMAISVTAIGEVSKEKITYRNTAKPNDIICVSGNLGAAYLGLQLLEREKEVFKVNPNMQPAFTGHDYILSRQLKPEARKDVVDKLAELDVLPTSMIDVSDGLSSEVLHLCNTSGTGCNIYEDKLPFDPDTVEMATEFVIDPTIAALNGGEDYELLFTISTSDYGKIKDCPLWKVIGYMTDEKDEFRLFGSNGNSTPLNAQGWDPILNR